MGESAARISAEALDPEARGRRRAGKIVRTPMSTAYVVLITSIAGVVATLWVAPKTALKVAEK